MKRHSFAEEAFSEWYYSDEVDKEIEQLKDELHTAHLNWNECIDERDKLRKKLAVAVEALELVDACDVDATGLIHLHDGHRLLSATTEVKKAIAAIEGKEDAK